MNFPLPYLKYQDSYELEYKITDTVVIQSLLNRLDLEYIGFSEDEVIIYKSIINTTNVVYRSIRPLSTLSNSTQMYYEKKELLYKTVNDVNVFCTNDKPVTNQAGITKSIPLSIKLSKETPTNINYNPIELIYKRARLSYYIKNSNIRFDVTYRYYPVNNDSRLYQTKHLNPRDLIVESDKQRKLHFTDYYNCKLVIDGEFEVSPIDSIKFDRTNDLSKSNNIDLLVEHTRLMCLLSNYDYFIERKILEYSPFDYTRTPQVNVFTTLDIQSFNYDDYVWSEKIDGVRTLIIVFDNKLLGYRSKGGINFITSINSTDDLNSLGITIIDTEYTEYNNTYYIFDVYAYDGIDVRNIRYGQRIMSLKNIMPKLYFESIHFKILRLNQIQTYHELVDHIVKQNSNTDGIVLHRKDEILSKWNDNTISYKVKTKSMSTIDFLFKYVSELDCYYLYLSGNHLILDSVVKHNSKFNSFVLNKNHMILFDSPYFKNSYKYSFNLDDVSKLLKQTTDSFDKKCLHNLVIECKYDNRWIPIRIREDKVYPNGYVVGLTNSINIFYPLEEYVEIDKVKLDIDNSNILMMLVQKYKDYFNINQIDSSRVSTFTSNSVKLNVIDYDGTISTNKNILDCDVNSLFVVNNNKLELIQYVQETFKYNLERNASNQYKITNEVSTVNLNVFEKTDDLIDKLLSCNDFVINTVNIILVNDLDSIDTPMFTSIKSYCNIDVKILYIYRGFNFKEDVFDKYKHDILTTIEYKNQYGVILNC